jgi:hypothetical protein
MYNKVIKILIVIIIIILLYRIYGFKFSESFEITREPKIAFLFLTYNNLKRPDIWNKFFNIENDITEIDNSSKYANKFSIYNHSKEKDKVTDILLKDRHIPENIDTCWGCFSTVEANILMMKAALKDPLNKKFILVSDSCLPIISFNKLYQELIKDDKNIINFWKENNTLDRYDSIIEPQFSKLEFKKHCAQGLIFNRTSTELLVNTLSEYKNKWKNMTCVDEHYFGNLLSFLDPNNIKNTIQNNNVTFDMWQIDKLNYENINSNDIKSDHYINLKILSNKAIDRLREHNFIFARKIDKDTEIDVDYILQ